jgi:hypothetical protein
MFEYVFEYIKGFFLSNWFTKRTTTTTNLSHLFLLSRSIYTY